VVSRDGLATIGEALSKARPGDTVEVGAGIYRERLELPEGVHLVARPPGGAVIEPRADAVQPAAALAVERLKSGSVAGFRIAAGGLPIGVLVADSDVELSGLDVEGAAAAGIAVRGGSRALLHSNYIHDNAGAGVLVEDSAAPRILSNIIVRNGRPPETVRAGLEVTGSARPEVEGNFLLNERNVSWATAVDLAQSNMLAAPPRPRRRP
jgi:parallel beta-helix repeat protein